MWKEFISDYLTFTSKERKGIILIIGIILMLVFLPYFFPYFSKKASYNTQDFEDEILKLEILSKDSARINRSPESFQNEFANDHSLPLEKRSENIASEMFYFDPNTATAADWKRLGIKDKTIKTIQNYISKGGKFYKPEDIVKIWGMSSSDAQRLVPYVRIKRSSSEHPLKTSKDYSKNKPVSTGKTIQMVDINLGDTSSYISLPGIGTKLSQRIIAFRDKLGGFYSIDQVGETYLLPDSTFQKIKRYLLLGNTPVKKININMASVDEMKIHPYLRYNIANAIFQYRQQHGDFKSLDELKKIIAVSDEIYIKVSPYLSIQ